METSSLLPLAPAMGAAVGLLFIYVKDGISPADIWRTASTAYIIVTGGSVLLSAAMLTVIQP